MTRTNVSPTTHPKRSLPTTPTTRKEIEEKTEIHNELDRFRSQCSPMDYQRFRRYLPRSVFDIVVGLERNYSDRHLVEQLATEERARGHGEFAIGPLTPGELMAAEYHFADALRFMRRRMLLLVAAIG